MESDPVKEQIKTWLQIARVTLNEAKDLGVDADMVLRMFKTFLDSNNLLILKIKYMTVFLESQIEIMNKIFMRLQKFNRGFQAKLSGSLGLFSELITQLNKRLTSLNNTLVDGRIKGFIGAKTGHDYEKEDFSLYDYLSIDEFLKLQENFEVLNDNLSIINRYIEDNQLKFFKSSLINFNNFCRNLVFEFDNVNNHFYQDLTELNLYSNDNTNTQISTNEKFSILINYYELEMANLVQSLAHHFDQCSEALQLYITGNHKQLAQLTQVLQEDSLEAPNVLSDLKILFLKIDRLQKNRSLEHLNSNLMKIYNELIINNFIVKDFLITTNRNLNIDVTTSNMNKLDFNFIKDLFVPKNAVHYGSIDLDLQGNINLITKYNDFLEKFEQSYYKLIVQIDHNHATNARIKKMIQNFMEKLSNIENESQNSNSEAARQLIRYLPSDLTSPLGTEDMKAPHVEVISEFEEYPELEKSLVEFAKKKLTS